MSASGITSTNVAETLAEIRQRVARRLARTVPEIPELAIPPLEPLRQARSVAEGWAAGMGIVNPRRPGLHNRLIQWAKTLIARGLRWFVFPQTQFNGGAVATFIRAEEMFADINRNLVVLGQNLVDARRKSDEEIQGARLVLTLLRDEFNAALEESRRSSEQISRSVGKSVEQVSLSVSRALEEVHADVARVQEQFWNDFARYRQEHAALHADLQAALEGELRLVRQRLHTLTSATPSGSTAPLAPATSTLPAFDYFRFEEYFRGPEEEIRKRQQFYLPILEGHAPVLDVACGRGEMLELLRSRGVEARGVDLDPDMVERCRGKKLAVERADALACLEAQPDASLGAVFSAQFIEHLPASAYARLIELAHAKLRSGGRLVLETQNPECLAIYSQTFFLDPSHVRPVPAAQLRFLLSEAGFTELHIHYLSPVSDSLPQLPLWPAGGNGANPAAVESWNRAAERFNRAYFGYMDYAIVGAKR